ncbi:hypothetical protein AM233_17230 [Bacillus sp. FJAT-22058]|nr:hypothetical protein AM233_17230 [Bacillus sp. FJAT-22058]
MYSSRTLILCFFTVILIGWKKYATLLPKSWVAKTPQALEPRRLGRQSAERERISEIDWNTFKIKKLQALALFACSMGERIAPYLLVPKFHKPNGL